MLKKLATKEDVTAVAKFLAVNLPIEAELLSKDHSRPQGKEVWTKAAWNCFEKLRVQLGEGWCLYPKKIGKARVGRVESILSTSY